LIRNLETSSAFVTVQPVRGIGAVVSLAHAIPIRQLTEHIRLGRIHPEAENTGGDIRALSDVFGMSIANAARWATTVGHSNESAVIGGNREHDPPGTR
jgi:hypothetical protein